MCRFRFNRFLCGHEARVGYEHCSKFDAKTGALHCGVVDFVAIFTEGACGTPGCRFEEWDGQWRCCRCLGGPNRTSACQVRVPRDGAVRRRPQCAHSFCEDCKPWKTKHAYGSIDEVVMGQNE